MGLSVATSLMPGEAVLEHVAILSITGRDFKVEPIRLKAVRPFVMKEMILSEGFYTRRPMVAFSIAKILSASPIDLSARWRMSMTWYNFIERRPARFGKGPEIHDDNFCGNS